MKSVSSFSNIDTGHTLYSYKYSQISTFASNVVVFQYLHEYDTGGQFCFKDLQNGVEKLFIDQDLENQ